MAADPDGGTDASAAEDASLDAAPVPEASTAPADATVAPPGNDASGEMPVEDSAVASDDGPQYVQPDGALPPYSAGNVYDLLCIQDPGVVPFDFSGVQAPYNDAAGCKAFDKIGHMAAHSCLCDACFKLQQQCDSLPGCQEIQKCGFDTGCTDANSCYLISGKCVTPINNWGTGSVATALSQALESCGKAASPSCPIQ
jgi:hypothetical protein